MSAPCHNLQNRLAEEGPAFLRNDDELRAHVESCETCATFLERLAEVDLALSELPMHDAPNELVARLLGRKELEEPIARPVAADKRSLTWMLRAGGLVAAALILFAVLTPLRNSAFEHALIPRAQSELENDEVLDGIEGGVAGGVVGGEALGGRDAATPPAESPPPPPPMRENRPRDEPEVVRSYEQRAVGKSEAFAEEKRADSDLRGEDAVGFFLDPAPKDKKLQDVSKNDLLEASAERDRQAGLGSLTFQVAAGYWSNTYVPGDPMLRFLDARLRELAPPAATTPIHDHVRRVEQPFDAPERSALAVYLSADQRAVTEPTRLTLQVGLRAMERQASRRPAMNVAVVIDRTGVVSLELDHVVVALVRALERAAELGDTIRYVVAGAAPQELELSPVLADTLADALARGIELVAGSEDPETVLGANLVLLVTGREQGADVARLEALAHRSAVGGIPVSAIALGAGTNASEMQRIALAGQGGRRLVAQPADAASVVDAELSAASRVVARAVRLRIRLAPGVELVEVLGAERLDAVAAGRVREAEKAIDDRLARNLGIASDRGEDEDGIQIVIPSFYAGDDHVILLDVVVPGPGAIADVTARYKDVGSLSNEIARASVSLARGELSRTAIELNVVKNVMAFRLSDRLEGAGEALSGNDLAGAIANLDEIRRSLDAARVEHPQLDDPGVRADITMLDNYLTLLGTGVTRESSVRDYVSASLRLASRLKLTSRLALD